MAHYLVSARPRKGRTDELKTRLRDRAFVSLKPFGKALSYSLQNARLVNDHLAVWEEEDYCNPPLKEERAAVLDAYFEDIRVERVARDEGWKKISSYPRMFPEPADQEKNN